MGKSSSNSTQYVVMGLALAAITSLLLYQVYKDRGEEEGDDGKSRSLPLSGTEKAPSTSKTTSSSNKVTSDAATPLVNNTTGKEKALHLKIEELDKRGKVLFKDKKYLEAADAFTEALDLIANSGGSKESVSLARQVVTLTNNRSAMYEKGGLADLALADCATILEAEVGHTKARTRMLRILEEQHRYREALIQVCALQLKFMKDNQAQLRMGIPVTPPVSQQKLEELVSKLLPAEVEKYVELSKQQPSRPLPSQYTLTQLLRSFSGYNSWMAAAAKSGPVSAHTQALERETNPSKKASIYLYRGRRYAHDKDYERAAQDFQAGYELVKDKPALQNEMDYDDYARLLEWVGMARHWKYDLEGSIEAYEKCSELEPTNVCRPVRLISLTLSHSNSCSSRRPLSSSSALV
jgi:tetratricopeptide (TPR) repeat protein